MERYEIVMTISVIGIGLFIGIKMKEFRKDMHHNDSWKSRKK